MNCAESHDLLLDLAYGELPPERAAEVTAHVLACAACRAEKEQLDDARKALAPLRDLEDPPEGFDEPILRAARAEAGLQSEGTPGPVVEVSATVKPLGLQAARLDPHAEMRRRKARQQPRWGRRLAILGSVAAAAGLAVVVGTSLPLNAPHRMAEDVAPIQVRAPGAPAPAALEYAPSLPGKAAAPEESRGAGSPKLVVPSPARAPEATRNKVASAPPPKKQADRRDQRMEAVGEKEGDQLAGFHESLQRADKRAEPQPAGTSAFSSPAVSSQVPPGALQETKREAEKSAGLKKQLTVPAAPPAPAQVAGGQVVAPQAAPPSSKQFEDQAGAGRRSGDDAGGLEDQAGAARRAGDYARAAALYREASGLRRLSDPTRAAWDLAHAVECLAAGGQMDEAIAVRKELLRAFPGQPGPKAAADSALRSVRLPPDEDPAPAQR